MEARTHALHPQQIIVTLEPDANTAAIKKAMKMIRGVASVRTVRVKAEHYNDK